MSARVLLFLTIPGHTFFVTVAWLIRLYPEGRSYDFAFLFLFLTAAIIQVCLESFFANEQQFEVLISHSPEFLYYDISRLPFCCTLQKS